MQIRALSFSEKRDWLRLSRTPRVGPVAFRDLLARYTSAEAALTALPDIMRRKAGSIPKKLIKRRMPFLFVQTNNELLGNFHKRFIG